MVFRALQIRYLLTYLHDRKAKTGLDQPQMGQLIPMSSWMHFRYSIFTPCYGTPNMS